MLLLPQVVPTISGADYYDTPATLPNPPPNPSNLPTTIQGVRKWLRVIPRKNAGQSLEIFDDPDMSRSMETHEPLSNELLMENVAGIIPLSSAIGGGTDSSNEEAQSAVERTDPLSREVKQLQHLNLTGFVYQIGRDMSAAGGYYDVFKGVLHSPGIHKRTIALKRIRIVLHDDPETPKVSRLRHKKLWACD